MCSSSSFKHLASEMLLRVCRALQCFCRGTAKVLESCLTLSSQTLQQMCSNSKGKITFNAAKHMCNQKWASSPPVISNTTSISTKHMVRSNMIHSFSSSHVLRRYEILEAIFMLFFSPFAYEDRNCFWEAIPQS